MTSFSLKMSLFSLFLFSLSLSISQAQVPANATFKYVNEGEFGPYINEYETNYRTFRSNGLFTLAFYNTTPNAYTLALRLGRQRAEPFYRWVWEANRGNPVRENATLTLGVDGNLVLADVDGRVAWQTNTANKGVVGLRLLPNGNIVLYDSKGKFVWQSFDYPTDTLLAGQSLRIGGINKLVSRLSEKENKDGPYSYVLEPKGLSLYYKSKNSAKSLLYFSTTQTVQIQDSLQNATLEVNPDDADETSSVITFGFFLVRPKYNSTFTFLRLGIDGNIKFYTYNDKVDWGPTEVTFTLFDRNSNWESECQLPARCGTFGVCEDNQCVACPSSKGLLGWSKSCEPEKLKSCRPSDFQYYKVEGVDHFLSKFTSGSASKESDCEKKCTSDCKCLGYFYNQQSSRCWIAYDLMTLTKVENSTHVGYIKTPKN
ncbi:hypothetical protein UlMin_028168 [Ulmus minor]